MARLTDTQNYQIFRIDLTDDLALGKPSAEWEVLLPFSFTFFYTGIHTSLHRSQKLSLEKTMNA